MLAYQVSIAQSECWVILTQLDEILIEVEYLWILLQIVPVKQIYAIGRLDF